MYSVRKKYHFSFIAWILLLAILVSCQHKEPVNMKERELNTNWKYQQINGKLKGRATVPGVIHTDLLNNKQIEDPLYRTNEKDLQWIDKEDWEYTTSFELTKEDLAHDKVILFFEGLDTYADVFVNEQKLLEADNMFREWEIDIKNIAKKGENQLKVYFHSPIKKGLKLLEASPYPYPAVNDQSENGGLGDKKVSIFTRKAGYHYGWDWGPRFVTSGIWRPVKLKIWDDIRIKNTFIRQPSVTKELAKLVADVTVEAVANEELTFLLMNAETKQILAQQRFSVSKGISSFSLPFEVKHPGLWWSAGLGEPHMYQFTVQVLKGGSVVAVNDVEAGLRSLKLIREKDQWGESFVFEINGVKVFAKGANYIPNDSFLPGVTRADYEKVVADAVHANMNMLRVWGGGIYENDYFYDLCDKNGIMVWQDFMFACSMYPGDDKMLASVKQEAIDNVIRLRNHPSIALWCGNNEMNAAWSYFSENGWGWKEQYTEAQREEIQKAYMDIFHKILPETVHQYTDGDDYWPSSPQAGFEVEKHAYYDNTGGDMHYWGVWHGLHPFEDFDKYKARFMSEYGFQSFPDFETVKKYTLPEDYDIESEVMAAHQRSGIGNLRIKEYMSWYYRVPEDFVQFLYMSQILQAQGIKMAIEAHRRAMPYCMGSLYWQINDCWPVASWSSTDYYHKWKAVHYAAKKAYEPLLISAPMKGDEVEIFVVSDLLEEIDAELKIEVLDFKGNKITEKIIPVLIKANTSNLIQKIEVDKLIGEKERAEVFMKIALIDNGKGLTSNLFYFTHPKELKLQDANINVVFEESNGAKIINVSTDNLAKAVYLNIPNQEVFFSDNFFDLIPGEAKKIEISGPGVFSLDSLRLLYLNQMY